MVDWFPLDKMMIMMGGFDAINDIHPATHAKDSSNKKHHKFIHTSHLNGSVSILSQLRFQRRIHRGPQILLLWQENSQCDPEQKQHSSTFPLQLGQDWYLTESRLVSNKGWSNKNSNIAAGATSIKVIKIQK